MGFGDNWTPQSFSDNMTGCLGEYTIDPPKSRLLVSDCAKVRRSVRLMVHSVLVKRNSLGKNGTCFTRPKWGFPKIVGVPPNHPF